MRINKTGNYSSGFGYVRRIYANKAHTFPTGRGWASGGGVLHISHVVGNLHNSILIAQLSPIMRLIAIAHAAVGDEYSEHILSATLT